MTPTNERKPPARTRASDRALDRALDPALVLSPDDVSRLRLVLLRVARRLRQHAAGMTQSQLSALASVERDGPLTIGDLAGIENVQPPSISRIVGTLEGEGWIERVASPHDARVALVQVTPKGSTAIERLRADRDAWLARRLVTLTPGEQKKVIAALPALEKLLETDGLASPKPGRT